MIRAVQLTPVYRKPTFSAASFNPQPSVQLLEDVLDQMPRVPYDSKMRFIRDSYGGRFGWDLNTRENRYSIQIREYSPKKGMEIEIFEKQSPLVSSLLTTLVKKGNHYRYKAGEKKYEALRGDETKALVNRLAFKLEPKLFKAIEGIIDTWDAKKSYADVKNEFQPMYDRFSMSFTEAQSKKLAELFLPASMFDTRIPKPMPPKEIAQKLLTAVHLADGLAYPTHPGQKSNYTLKKELVNRLIWHFDLYNREGADPSRFKTQRINYFTDPIKMHLKQAVSHIELPLCGWKRNEASDKARQRVDMLDYNLNNPYKMEPV